ncbi:acyl-CoA dehydrogenase family protein [Oricola nitratireducens]|uniref:acyl-CoA dehydrogenase family protein n=1 Tax=Oricola nitratireducens TaxID=2775868 RepID=UPI001866B593|nr:acyl-CoA dehydrogenase [Oricola nitratireducens]
MDLQINEQQRLLKESVQKLAADLYPFEKREAIRLSEAGWSRDYWAQYAELGLAGLTVEEAYGGIGCGPFETMVVMEELGRSLAPEPFVATVLLGGGLIRHAGNEEQKERLLPGLCSGELLLAFAHLEEQARHELHDIATVAAKTADGYRLKGRKTLVLHGSDADVLVVAARLSGDRLDRDGIGLFLVAGDASGVSRQGHRTIDGRPAAEIVFQDVDVPSRDMLDAPGETLAVIERVADETIAALAAEGVGVMDEMLKMTIEHVGLRKQFGTEIASFQAIQHRLADMYIALEQARSMAIYAAGIGRDNDPERRGAGIAAAKVQLCRSLRYVGQQAIQLHGGIGMTMEYKVGHLFQRATAIEALFGGAEHHLQTLAAGGGLFAA